MSQEIVIEIDLGANDPEGEHAKYNRNGSLGCEILGKTLRAVTRTEFLDHENLGSDIRLFPQLPGLRIAIDVRAGKVRIFDPLKYDPRGQKKLDQFKKMKRPHFFKPVEDDIRQNLQPRQIREWLMWCWRQTELAPFHAVVVSEGGYPPWVAKCVEADVRFELYHDVQKRDAVLKDELNKILDEVQEASGKQLAGSGK